MKWKITLVNSGCPERIVEGYDQVIPLSYYTVKFSGYDEYRDDSISAVSSSASYDISIFFKCDTSLSVPDKVILERVSVGISNHADVVFEVNKEFTKEELSTVKLAVSPAE